MNESNLQLEFANNYRFDLAFKFLYESRWTTVCFMVCWSVFRQYNSFIALCWWLSVPDTTLTLANIQATNAGIYQCFARNHVGSAFASIKLQVFGEGHVMTVGVNGHPVSGKKHSTSIRRVSFSRTISPLKCCIYEGYFLRLITSCSSDTK